MMKLLLLVGSLVLSAAEDGNNENKEPMLRRRLQQPTSLWSSSSSALDMLSSQRSNTNNNLGGTNNNLGGNSNNLGGNSNTGGFPSSSSSSSSSFSNGGGGNLRATTVGNGSFGGGFPSSTSSTTTQQEQPTPENRGLSTFSTTNENNGFGSSASSPQTISANSGYQGSSTTDASMPQGGGSNSFASNPAGTTNGYGANQVGNGGSNNNNNNSGSNGYGPSQAGNTNTNTGNGYGSNTISTTSGGLGSNQAGGSNGYGASSVPNQRQLPQHRDGGYGSNTRTAVGTENGVTSTDRSVASPALGGPSFPQQAQQQQQGGFGGNPNGSQPGMSTMNSNSFGGKQDSTSSSPAVPNILLPPSCDPESSMMRRGGRPTPISRSTWTASFPGSGIKLLWKTVEGLTGMATSDDNDTQGYLQQGTAVTVKTHYPSPHVSPKFFLLDTTKMQTAILLLRNPMYVLPSYYKFLYRHEFNPNAEDPEAKVPIDQWVAWRNEQFVTQLDKWYDHTKWWIDHYPAQGQLFVLSFEHLVEQDVDVGVETLKQIGGYLASVDPVVGQNLIPEQELPCFWETHIGMTAPEEMILARQKAKSGAAGKKKKAAGPNAVDVPTYPFTVEQMDHIIDVIRKLKREFNEVAQVNDLMQEYIKSVSIVKRKIQKLLEQ